jgi:peptidoglycan/LPS O-acetylase OafA/YrhL
MLSKNTSYISRLDHLRFFAALLVAAYHFHSNSIRTGSLNPLLMLIKEGETGVSLFMVLSGFILTRIAFGKQIDYKSFIYNRILRIYPLYTLMVFIAAFSAGRHMDFVSFVALMSPMGNMGNVYLEKFPHIWTVAVEFQFYLIFPFIVRFFARYGVRYLFGVIGVAIAIRVMLYLTDGSVQDASYWTILGRVDQFAIGMIAAAIYGQRTKWLSSPVALCVSFAAVYLWFFLFNKWSGGFYGKNSATSFAWVVSPTAEATVWAGLSLAYLQQKWHLPAVIDRTLAYLGAISFSMYMWHYPIIVTLDKSPSIFVFHEWYLNFLLIVLPIILAASSLSYFVVEKPFFAMRTVYTKPSVAPLDPNLKVVRAERSRSSAMVGDDNLN